MAINGRYHCGGHDIKKIKHATASEAMLKFSEIK